MPGAADGLCGRAECGRWSAVARCLFNPALPRRGQELFFVFLDQLDERLIAGIFVAGGPENHFSEDGCEIDAFGGKRVNEFSPV